MTGPVVADAGPLIGLARINRLELLRGLYGEVRIPPIVQEELRLTDDRPGARILAAAAANGWLRSETLPLEKAEVSMGLDPGEAAALQLALSLQSRFLLIDDARGRAVALRAGLRVVGVAGILLAAKQRELLPAVRPELELLQDAGYRISAELQQRVLMLAGEA